MEPGRAQRAVRRHPAIGPDRTTRQDNAVVVDQPLLRERVHFGELDHGQQRLDERRPDFDPHDLLAGEKVIGVP